ncbi:MAG: alkaline phosphatase family protein [Pirellulaceae bacterium]|nr:alkaline phosphatase family protein [Pirellulaceae bacterium]
MKNKVLLIGWDAADWKVIHELMDEGKMPTLQSMVERGTMGNLRTLNPPLSPMLWTSIATGKRPYKHGIYGFTEPTPSGDAVQPMTNISRSSKAIWNILNQHDQKSVVVGWWPSHPAEPIRGAMVSDFFHKSPKKPGDAWPLRNNCVHPPEKLAEIGELRVHPMELTAEDILPFVPDGSEIDQTNDRRIASVMKVTAECSSVHAAATHLLESEPWDFAAIYYDAIDHYSHGFMKFRAPQQKHITDHDFKMYRHVVDTGYIYHDMMLKQLLEYTDEDTTVMLISDHGFHPDHLRPVKLPNEPAGPAKEHRDYGIFVATGPNIQADHIIHGANLLDITPTILASYGLPVGADMDGRVLEDIFADKPQTETIDSWEDVEGDTGQHPAGFTISAEESKAALDQLVALGYIDPPEDDSSVAVASCERELQYNLARAYMDAELHGEAAPILLELYQNYPLEFRFGIQLAACFRALDESVNLKLLLQDMNDRWRKGAEIAKDRIRDFAVIAKERRDHWKELKKLEDEESDSELSKIARVDRRGRPILFNDNENLLIRKLRSIAKGNPQTLDFLSATVAASEGDFENALALMERARLTDTTEPAFQFQLGSVYISLNRLEDAEASMLKGLSIDEYHPKCLMGLSRCYFEMGRNKRALEMAQKAIGLQYHFPMAHYFYGLSQQRLGNFDAAIASLNTAVKQNPNFEETHNALAEIYGRSVIDESLALEHRSLSKQLAEENLQRKETTKPIPFIEKTLDELSEHLPSILTLGIDDDFEPSLNQAKRTDTHTDSNRRKSEKPAEVILVSGLPRSGTSMMMQMLAAGGLPIFTDGHRIPDDNNPKGYYEADLVKGLGKKNRWVHDCDGQVIKVVSPLVQYLPQAINYKVIYMRRPIPEIISSQTRMLERLGEEHSILQDEEMAKVMREQAHSAISLLSLHQKPLLRFSYSDVLANPMATAATINEFLGLQLDEAAMAQAVDPSLYREKQSS